MRLFFSHECQMQTTRGQENLKALSCTVGKIYPEAAVTTLSKTLVWKRGVSKQDILQSHFCHVLGVTSHIRIIFDIRKSHFD